MLQQYIAKDHVNDSYVQFYEKPTKIYKRLEEIIYILSEYDVDLNTFSKKLPQDKPVTLSIDKVDKALLYKQDNIFHIYPIA